MKPEVSSDVSAALAGLVDKSWDAYGNANLASIKALVRPSMPILFFGDPALYRASPLRIVTVGLNPSRHEFPVENRFLRFPDARHELSARPLPQTVLQALSNYFRKKAYSEWFDPAFKEVLLGMDASFYGTSPNTALHTDICTPLATDPTWSRLSAERPVLISDGRSLWHELVRVLEPDVVIISVAREHVDSIQFPKKSVWKNIHTIQRDQPFRTDVREIEIAPGKRTLLVYGYGQPLKSPFAPVKEEMKFEIGQAISKEWKSMTSGLSVPQR